MFIFILYKINEFFIFKNKDKINNKEKFLSIKPNFLFSSNGIPKVAHDESYARACGWGYELRMSVRMWSEDEGEGKWGWDWKGWFCFQTLVCTLVRKFRRAHLSYTPSNSSQKLIISYTQIRYTEKNFCIYLFIYHPHFSIIPHIEVVLVMKKNID